MSFYWLGMLKLILVLFPIIGKSKTNKRANRRASKTNREIGGIYKNMHVSRKTIFTGFFI